MLQLREKDPGISWIETRDAAEHDSEHTASQDRELSNPKCQQLIILEG